MPRRLYYETFHPETIYVHSKPWTPTMIRQYRNLSLRRYKTLRLKFSSEDILRNDSVTANHTRTRTFIDKSETMLIDNRVFSLAMIYYVLFRDLYPHERVQYRVFAQRVRQSRVSQTHISLLAHVDNVAERMGSRLPSRTLANITDEMYARIQSQYVKFINDNRPKKEFYTQPNVNDRWYECAREDPDMHWYLFKLHDEMYMKLSTEYKQLELHKDALAQEVLTLRSTVEQLQIKLLRRNDEPPIITEFV